MTLVRNIIVVLALCALFALNSSVAAQSTTIVVNTASDVADFGGAQTVGDLPGADGLVTLREAIIAANNTIGPNTIAFNIPTTDPGFHYSGFTGQFVIFVENGILQVTDNQTTIDGRTQTTFTGDTNPSGSEIHIRTTPPYMNQSGLYVDSDNNVVVGLDGFSLFRYGIQVNGSNNLIIGNSMVQSGSAGVSIMGSNNRVGGTTSDAMNRILGSTTGVQITGAAATGNVVQGNLIWRNNSYGVSIGSGASGNTIGGATASARNFIYSNGHTDSERFPVGADISLSGSSNLVQGNSIGVDQTGAPAGGVVWSGIELTGSSNTIRGNLISGHTGFYSRLTARPAGIRIYGGRGNVIQGNLIGTDATGTQALANEYGIKVEVWQYANVPQDITIGGRGPGEANVIAFNMYDGVAIGGNTVRVSANVIFGNGELGINLAPDVYTQVYPYTVTPNDPGDQDSGPNNLQNFPVITSVGDNGTSTTVRGTIDTPNAQLVTIELFSNDAADASGYGEGQVFQGTTTPDSSGHFVATLPGGLNGKYVTATATDAAGNTSEFSRAVPVGGQANQPPIAVASATPQSGTAPLTVNFSSSGSRDPDGTIVTYHWNFGDSTSSTLPNPSHTYASAGTYQATLTVTDNAGAFTSAVLMISATPAPAIRSTDITLSATLRNTTVTVQGKVKVKDGAGALVSGATVYAVWTRPNGTTVSQKATTNTSGIASFNTKGGRGTYTLTVTAIAKAGYVFDPVSSVLSKSITK